ncbi:MAG: hypothetical protein O3C43_19375 [Verrucomicrobia bacterium]|nr:hypothetical protein [Verrucomicrobiota bacterium]MDA1068652.1 hypothetical protein [Verrucomicrobiota bacterium]
MVLELLLAQFAIASPQLHGWLHGIGDCERHQCCSSTENQSDPVTGDDHVCTIAMLADGIFQDTEPLRWSTFEVVETVEAQTDYLEEAPPIAKHAARSPPNHFR